MTLQCSARTSLPIVLIAALHAAACIEPLDLRPPRQAVLAAPTSIHFTSAPNLHNRHHYAITQSPWGSPNIDVGDEVWRLALPAARYLTPQTAGQPYALGVEAGELASAMNEPAPYTQGTPLVLDVTFDVFHAPRPAALEVKASGVLRSMTDPTREPIALFVHHETLVQQPVGYAPLRLTTGKLPARVDLYALTITWELGQQPPVTTRHLVPLTWRAPIRELPKFREPFVWAAAFAAGGQWPDGPRSAPQTEQSEIAISARMLAGFTTLPKQYGSFPRPKYDGKSSGLEMFLDFPRSACGEFKFGLMALIETHGIDAQWGALHFDAKELGPLSRERLSFYKTRKIAALGREAKHWYYANHAFTVVRNQIFDPTYNVHKPSLAEYDDYMFEKYCYGESTPCKVNSWCDTAPQDEATRCIDNPPGFKSSMWRFFSGDSYY